MGGKYIPVPVDRSFWALIAIFIIGAYGGYFGAASGIFMLLVFSMTRGLNLLIANAIKNVVMGATNLVATIVYIFFGHIAWAAALPMAIGFIIGGAVGPAIARHLPANFLRWLIIIGAFILAGDMYYQAFM